jgi:hypothetical protein
MKSREKDLALLQKVVDKFPELADTAARIKQGYEDRTIRDQPWRWDQCKSWLDGWLYVYRRCYLDYSQHLAWKDEQVFCSVWVGPDFNDGVIDWLERFHSRFGVDTALAELRLIGTRVSFDGLDRLRKLFPDAKLKTYSWEDVKAHPELQYAGNFRR